MSKHPPTNIHPPTHQPIEPSVKQYTTGLYTPTPQQQSYPLMPRANMRKPNLDDGVTQVDRLHLVDRRGLGSCPAELKQLGGEVLEDRRHKHRWRLRGTQSVLRQARQLGGGEVAGVRMRQTRGG